MRLAVIDCGTNTFNLIIIEVDDRKKYSKIDNTRIPVKLGEGAINKGFIAPDPFNRGIEAINAFNELIKKHNVDKIIAFATSAIRDAANGELFVQTIHEKFRIRLTVIDGNREAELIYLGIREAVQLNSEASLIMDIGGGSTELIIANRDTIFWKGSFRIGAARLLEKFCPSNPISASEINAIHEYLYDQLTEFFEVIKTHPPSELVGSSGAFDSLVEMINGELGGEPLTESKTAYDINMDAYFQISSLVQSSTLEERKKIRGLVPMRFDMIVISCLMVDFILKACALSKLRVSVYSLKEGALMDFIGRES
jgi:exopolyphosphatase / guanosine-5'-triphosphate,3'-diphosphate pyrophosphatase